MESQASIRIPIGDNNQFVEVFPDEMPADVNDLIDALRAEFAPIKIWRAVAIEYHRQGFHTEFKMVLQEIIAAMAEPDVEEFYRDKPEYHESIAEIYNALAADALVECNDQLNESSVQEYLKKADPDYSMVIKGLHELRAGNIDRVDYYFRNLFTQANRQPSAKKPFLYIANIGLGCVQFAKGRYPTAQEHFAAAVRCHPHPHSSVRIALASCMFMQQQYDKCTLTATAALESDPSNGHALVLLSLLDRITAQKDRNRRKECRSAIYENCLMAAHIDPSCVMALNHMANHYFNTWRILDGGVVADAKHIRFVLSESLGVIHEGDLLRIDRTLVTSIGSVERQSDPSDPGSADSILVTLKTEVTPEILAKCRSVELEEDGREGRATVCVELKELNQVRLLAGKAYRTSNVTETKAESMFILARLYHVIGDVKVATHFYEETIKLCPDMSLAAMLLGQLMFATQDFPAAQRLFEQVLVKYPEDKDTRAYLALVKCVGESREITKMDKLKEIAPGFVWEEELWLLQGQLRLGNVLEHGAALKCLESALECAQKRGQSPDPNLLLNMSVLHHALGSPLSSSFDLIRRSLMVLQTTSTSADGGGGGGRGGGLRVIPFRCPENDVFFVLSDVLCDVVISDVPVDSYHSFGCVTVTVTPGPTTASQSLDFIQDESVVIGDVLFSVESAVTVDAEGVVSFVAKAPVLLPALTVLGEPRGYPLRHRRSAGNFNDRTVTHVFNYGRILEDMGRTTAAIEIYAELLRLHPSFVECCVRLCKMSSDLGRVDAALAWANRALVIDENNPDVHVCLGDLYTRRREWEQAKREYERVCKEHRHDPRCMLGLGNLFFANLNLSSKYDTYLKDSQKFFSIVLSDDVRNAFAANGFAMVCAERGSFDLSRDIFGKVRDTGICSHADTCCNLANIYLAQSRFGEAVVSYQAAVKSITQTLPPQHYVSSQSPTRRLAGIYECLSLAHFKHQQHSDAVRYIMRTLHLDPTASHNWYNQAYLREEFAVHSLRKPNKTIKDIEMAIVELETANRLFRLLSDIPSEPSLLSDASSVEKYDSGKVKAHYDFCQSNLSRARELRTRASAEEALRRSMLQKQQQEQEQRMLERKREKEAELEAVEAERRQQQQKAAQRAAQLDALQQTWRENGGAPSSSSKREKEKGRKRGRGDDDDAMVFDSESDDEPADKTGSGAAAPVGTLASLDNLFGSEDEDEGEEEVVAESGGGGGGGTVSRSMEDRQEAAAGGRLRRTPNTDAEDEDEEDIFGENEDEEAETATAMAKEELASELKIRSQVVDEQKTSEDDLRVAKQRRIIDDDEDEQ